MRVGTGEERHPRTSTCACALYPRIRRKTCSPRRGTDASGTVVRNAASQAWRGDDGCRGPERRNSLSDGLVFVRRRRTPSDGATSCRKEGRQVHAMDALVVRAEGDGIRPSVLLTSHARLGGQVRQRMERIHHRRNEGEKRRLTHSSHEHICLDASSTSSMYRKVSRGSAWNTKYVPRGS